MTWYYSQDFLTPSSVTATSEMAGYEDDYLTSWTSHPITRHWRTNNSTSQTDIIFDFGTTRAFVAIVLLGANFTSVELAHSSDNVSYTSLTGGPFSISQKLPGGYYNRIVIQSASNRYGRVRIPSGQSTVGSVSYYKLGAVLFLASLSPLARIPQLGMTETVNDPQTTSGDDMAPAGPLSVSHEWQQIYEASNITPFWNFQMNRRHTPVLWYDDRGYQYVWLARFEDAISMKVDRGSGGVLYTVNPKMKELA